MRLSPHHPTCERGAWRVGRAVASARGTRVTGRGASPVAGHVWPRARLRSAGRLCMCETLPFAGRQVEKRRRSRIVSLTAWAQRNDCVADHISPRHLPGGLAPPWNTRDAPGLLKTCRFPSPPDHRPSSRARVFVFHLYQSLLDRHSLHSIFSQPGDPLARYPRLIARSTNNPYLQQQSHSQDARLHDPCSSGCRVSPIPQSRSNRHAPQGKRLTLSGQRRLGPEHHHGHRGPLPHHQHVDHRHDRRHRHRSVPPSLPPRPSRHRGPPTTDPRAQAPPPRPRPSPLPPP